MKTANLHVIHTGQVSIFLDQTLSIPAEWTFTCDSAPVKRAANADFTAIPGSVILAHLAVIDATNNDVEIHHCADILPQWYINTSTSVVTWKGGVAGFKTPPNSYADLEAIRTNMITAGDVGITSGQAAKLHDLAIFGFDNCLYSNPSQDLLGKNISMDCDIGLYAANSGGASTIKDFDNNPFLTKQTGVKNEEYWDIVGVSASPIGECRLTLKATGGAFPLSDIQQSDTTANAPNKWRGDPYNYPAWVSGFPDAGLSCLSASTGQFGNDAAWALHYVNTSGSPPTVDLVGSKYTSSKTTGIGVSTQGGWDAGTGIIHISGSISNIAPGMVASSGDPSWPSQTVNVVGIAQRCTGLDPDDGFNGCVIVSPAPASASATVAATGITFYSTADNLTPTSQSCDGTGKGYCLYYNAAERYIAGQSAAGIDSARLPGARGGHLGAGLLIDNISGLRGINNFSYGHYYHTAAIDSADCSEDQVKGDDNGELGAGNTVGLYVTGFSRGCDFLTQNPGKPGDALVVDTYGVTDLSPEPNTVDVSALGPYNTATITIPGGVPGAWPMQGELHICQVVSSGACETVSGTTSVPNEIVAYQKTGPSTVLVYVRGRFGTPPIDWSCATGYCGTAVYLFWSYIVGGSSKHPAQSSATIFSAISNPSTVKDGNLFEVHHGSVILNNVHTGNTAPAFVSGNSSGVTITASGETGASIYFENDTARAVTTLSPDSATATYVPQGVLNLPLSHRQWFGSPQAVINGSSITASRTGSFAVQSTADWPQTGVLQIDQEYIAFHIADATHLSFDTRGACNSMPASHNDKSMVSYMNLLYGCPALGEGQPQMSLDASGNVGFAQSALAHGQVYLNLQIPGTGTPFLQLCPKGGGGLIINGALRAVPPTCAILPTTAATASGINYVYASYHLVAVTAATNDSGVVRLLVTDNSNFYAGSRISCFGVRGITGANVTNDLNTTYGTDISGSPYIDLTDVPYPSMAPAAVTGACYYIGMNFDTVGHTTAGNGVETKSGVPALTLVGMVYNSATSGITDSVTIRDVASWFNRKIKTCKNAWASNAAISAPISGFQEFTSGGAALHCEFISWGQDDLAWNLFGAVNDSTSEFPTVAAGFDGLTATPEIMQWQGTASQRFSVSLSGSAQALMEGSVHYMTILGAAPAGSLTMYAKGGDEVRIPQ